MKKVTGCVERFGPQRIDGWVAWNREAGRNVVFKLNGVELAQTVACRAFEFQGETKDYGFARYLGDLWNYLGEGDVVSVEYDGSPLPIAGHGHAYVHTSNSRSKSRELFDLIGDGQIFDKKGRLATALSDQSKWGEQFFSEFEGISKQLRATFGIELFPMYGTLLGAIREGDFIAHDNDVDYTYVSSHSEPDKVKMEFIKICEFLIDLGYRGYLSPYTFNIKAPLKFDIYYSWFNEAGEYQVSFGYHGVEAKKSNDFFKFETRPLGKHVVRVPLSAEAILSQLYGNWKVPDPGFSHYSRSRKINAAYVLSYEQLQPLYWKQFYKRRPPSDNSQFAGSMQARLPANSVILDIGCGNGRDALFFAALGHTVVGFDTSDVAIESARRAARRKRLTTCKFLNVDVADMNSVRHSLRKYVFNQRDDRRVVVYLRFFIHSVPAKVERAMLRLFHKYLKSFTLMAEFRTVRDESLPKTHAPHYIRYIESSAFIARLRRHGMEIEFQEEGTGLSPYKTEDPHLCRVIAHRECGSV